MKNVCGKTKYVVWLVVIMILCQRLPTMHIADLNSKYYYKYIIVLGCTGCIKKMVIELWRAIRHSIFNIQK